MYLIYSQITGFTNRFYNQPWIWKFFSMNYLTVKLYGMDYSCQHVVEGLYKPNKQRSISYHFSCLRHINFSACDRMPWLGRYKIESKINRLCNRTLNWNIASLHSYHAPIMLLYTPIMLITSYWIYDTKSHSCTLMTSLLFLQRDTEGKRRK